MDETNNDPLNIAALASNYDNLLTEISNKTQELAEKLLNYVEEHANSTQSQIDQINSLLTSVNNSLQTSNDIDNSIQMLQQLYTFTTDFNERLSTIENLINSHQL